MNDFFSPKLPDLDAITQSHHDLNRSMEQIFHAKRERDEELSGRNDARYIFEDLSQRVARFQKRLADDEELGLQLANFGIPSTIHIRRIGFRNPCLIVFFGLDAEGNDVELVQHISQLNFVLTALKPLPDEKPYRMGF